MRTHARLMLAAAIWSAVPAWAANEVAHNELLRSARLWELRHRDDLATAALEKILLIEPGSSQAMLALGLLKIRENKMEEARQLVERLRLLPDGALEARQLADAYRVATRDRLKMATVRRLAESNKVAQAIEALHELFPSGAPAAELGVEYYQILGLSTANWNVARAGLTQLAKAYPEDPRYRLALARFLLRKDATSVEGRKLIEALSQDPDVDPVQVADLRKNARSRQVASSATKSSSPTAAERAARLRAQSDEALAQDKQGLALRKLEEAVNLVPSDPWSRFSLAKLYVRFELPEQAIRLMQEGVVRAPKDPEMHYAQALILSSLDDEAAALAALSHVPPKLRSEGMRALDRRLHASIWRKQVEQLSATQDYDRAEQVLKNATAQLGLDPEWVGDVASSWMKAGQTQRALALMEGQLGQPEQAQGKVLLAWAELFNQQPDDPRLAPLISRLKADISFYVANKETINRLQASVLLRHVDQLRAVDRYDEALALIDGGLQNDSSNLRLLSERERVVAAHADAMAERGNADAAAAIFRQLLQRKPHDVDLMLSYARSLRLGGHPEAAMVVLEDAEKYVDAEDVSGRLALVRQYVSLDRTEPARRIMKDLLKRAPDNASVLVQAGRVEKEDRNYEAAANYFHRARQAELLAQAPLVSGQTQTPAEEELDRLEKRRPEGFIAVGFNPRNKPGDPGVSEFNEMEIPVELVLPAGYDARYFAHLDTVLLDAGTLPSVYNDAAFYGKVQAFGPTSLANFPNGAEQKASGVAVGLGYENERWRFDLGSTPLGFPVVDIVGGVKYSSSWGATDYSVNLSRRPITSSLLSYSGARDPVTGEIWGGVRATGVDARIARDFGRLGTSLSGGFHSLTGQNVASNTFLSVRAAADWLFVDREDSRLTAGLALTQWRYSKDLSGYTFGQGGYYSPKSYTALALPIDWRGRIGRWSYRLRPALSYSRSTTQDSPFYPTDAGLQARAAASPLPPGYTRPVFDGGSGSGLGYSFKGALEYQVLSDYFVGGSFELDRSEYYAPNSMIFYVRHMFRDWLSPVPYPPSPPKSYADY